MSIPSQSTADPLQAETKAREQVKLVESEPTTSIQVGEYKESEPTTSIQVGEYKESEPTTCIQVGE